MDLRGELNIRSDTTSVISITKNSTGVKALRNGHTLKNLSELAGVLPALVFNSKLGDILTEGPSNRRALLDKAAFHVEPRFIGSWRKYKVALSHRNALLRAKADRSLFVYWDENLSVEGEKIEAARQEVVLFLNEKLLSGLGHLFDEPVYFKYSSGWGGGSFAENLLSSFERDMFLGYTSIGVHRADLKLMQGRISAGSRFSRGQLKICGVETLVALALYIELKTGVRPLLLVDDLSSELDKKLFFEAVDKITGLGAQTIFTSVSEGGGSEIQNFSPTMFHVEQGELI